MARKTSFVVQFVRVLLLLLGAFMWFDMCRTRRFDAAPWATTFVVVGFPYSLAWWLLRLPFRILLFLLRLFGIVKRKPAHGPPFTVEVRGVEGVSEWGDDPATEKQLGFLSYLGGNPSKGMTKSQASEMIDALLLQKDVDRIKAARRKARSE